MIIISGPARTGKSTILSILSELGYTTLSSSVMLAKIAQTLVDELHLPHDVSNKDPTTQLRFSLETNGNWTTGQSLTPRNYLEIVASSLSRVYGERPAVPALAQAIEQASDPSQLVVELLDNYEYEQLTDLIQLPPHIIINVARTHAPTVQERAGLVRGVTATSPTLDYSGIVAPPLTIHSNATSLIGARGRYCLTNNGTLADLYYVLESLNRLLFE